MSWEISHTTEAWENVRSRLSLKKWKPDLAKALNSDDEAKHEEDETHEIKSVRFYSLLPQDVLVDAVMDRIEEHRTCDNGGFEFYLDREGWYRCSCDDLTPQEQRALGL